MTQVVTPANIILGAGEAYYRALGVLTAWSSVGGTMDDTVMRIAQSWFRPDLNGMLAMLDSALTFARDDASAEPATRVDLAVLLQSLCDDLRDAGKPVRYEGPLHLACNGRPVALRRAFANLVDNAVAYGSEATVTLLQLDGVVEVTVGDRGPGIPESLRERVFAPFFRGEPSRSRDTGGTGLGLTIARAVVDRHGGSIALEDRAGGGLLVRVRLPCP